MDVGTPDSFSEDNQSIDEAKGSRKLIPKDTLMMDKLELQHLIKEKDKRITFQKNGNGSSPVWKTFRIIIVDGMPLEYVCCKKCLIIYKYTSSGGTTGLNRHRAICKGTNSRNESSSSESDNDADADELETIDSDLEQLISSVKIRPELYDGTEESVRTENLWSLIATEVEKKSEWCRKSWKSLIAKFLKEYKIVNGNTTNSSWVYMESLEFLGEYAQFIENKFSQSSKQKRKFVSLQPKRERPEIEEMEGLDQFTSFLNVGNEFENDDSNSVSHISHNNYTPSSKHKKYSNSSPHEKDLWSINLQHQERRKLDAHDLFCMSLAIQMRSMPKIYASKARLKITEVMHSIGVEADRDS